MTSNALLTYNLETSNPEKSNKQVKLISFEKILSTSSLKTPPVESKQQQQHQKDDIKLESDVLNLMNFDLENIENNSKVEKIKEKSKKFNETRVVFDKNAAVYMNTEEDRVSVKSSQYSERMSEKMVENIKKNHGETEKLIENFKKYQGDQESSKKSDGGVEIKNLGSPLKNLGGFLETPVKTPEITHDETKINNKMIDEKIGEIRSNPVISLVKFIRKDDSKRYILINLTMFIFLQTIKKRCFVRKK